MNDTSNEVKQQEKYLAVKDVKQQLNISRSLVYRMVNEGELRAVRINSAIRIRQSDLDAYIRDHQTV